jgi:DNA-binding LacI/PurR family transcriptional regulator
MHGLTSFAEPLHEQGEAAVDMLSQWIKSGKQPENRMLNCNLVERSSVASI